MAPARKGWGSLTRKGAASMNDVRSTSSREIERTEKPRVDRDNKPQYVAKSTKQRPVPRASKKHDEAIERPRFVIPDDAIKEIEVRAGKRAERLLRYLKEAGTAYASERWADAKKSLRPLLIEVPDAPVVQELHGMVLYRQGKWQLATKELELAHLATRSFDLYPALMDCYRALRKWKKVETLWDELRAESPSAEVTSEGRIVAAGAKADQGREQDGIRLMEKAPRPKTNPKEHHLRSWYVLADLYDRVGESSKARSLFQKVAQHDPELADVLERLDALD
jgi:tetratricopeptide (TPR) repeat protein